MSLFKKRLLELFIYIVIVAVVNVILYGISKLLSMIHPLAPVIVGMTLFAAVVLFIIGYFINWLLIEPFRKGSAK
jgi:Na+/H+-dicarboxylate symporter